MKKVTLAIAAGTALALACVGTSEADAQGFHFRSGAMHIDVGNAHHGRSGYYGRRNYGNYGSYGRVQFGRIHYGGHYGGHNTGHYDWHPPSLQPHNNHLDYVPGHYDFHRGGHHNSGHGHQGRYRQRRFRGRF